MADVELKLKGVSGEGSAGKRRANAGSIPNSWKMKTKEDTAVVAAISKTDPQGKRKRP